MGAGNLFDYGMRSKVKSVQDEVRLTAIKAEGALALAAHIMEGVIGLDEHRKSISAGDPVTDVLLTEIEVAAVRHVKSIQGSLYNNWRL